LIFKIDNCFTLAGDGKGAFAKSFWPKKISPAKAIWASKEKFGVFHKKKALAKTHILGSALENI
jgi:hypothetical protein